MPKESSFYKYICKIIICIVITSKKYLSLNIWPKIFNQSISNKNLIFITWYNRAKKQNKINFQEQYSLNFIAKKPQYESYINFN